MTPTTALSHRGATLGAAPIRHMLWFMHERQRIYLKRQAGKPAPWTDDSILRSYKFENVYREQDRCTVYIRQHWREPYADHPNLWFAMCLARTVNWPDTLAEIGFPEVWNPKRVLDILESRRKLGKKTFTSAYFLQHHGEQGAGGKARYVVNRVLDPLWQAVARGNTPPIPANGKPVSPQEWFGWLANFYGFGDTPGFLTYEVITDLRHTRYLRDAPDIYSWANAGPGANNGICRLTGREVETKIPRSEQLQYMCQIFRGLDANRDRRLLPTLEMRDVEHNLCSFDKWCRAHAALKANQRITLERFRAPIRDLFGGFARIA